MMDIANKIAIVTGANSGLGLAVCQLLHPLNAQLIAVDINPPSTELLKTHPILSFECDIKDDLALESLFKTLLEKKYIPDIVVNCAGIAPAKRMVNQQGAAPLDWFKQVVEINLVGTFNVMRLATNLMVHHRNPSTQATPIEEKGVIINVSSIAAFEGQIGQIAYSAAKGGVAAMTLPAARELASYGIRVMSIAPGLFDTPMVQNFKEDVIQKLKEQTLFPKRLGKSEEFALCVKHIIENPMLNGSIIRLDGGCRLNAY